jgi:hypothetical protein
MVSGILFKFSCDTELSPNHWLYGSNSPSDANAIKSASHELKSLTYFEHFISNAKIALKIRTPLIALIDYRGYRLLASSVLPVSKSTIVHGNSRNFYEFSYVF